MNELIKGQATLSAHVQAIVPAARIETLVLPQIPALRLLLLNADYPRGPIPDDLAQRLMDQPFYWAFCWASGAVLAQHLLAHPDLVENKKVIDFGSGSGVVAIAAAMAGAAEVIACDIDPWALIAIEANAALNQVTVNLSSDFFAIDSNADVILAADVLYDRDNLPWLDIFLSKAPQVIVADSRLKDFSHPQFSRIATRSACTLPDLDESEEFRSVNLYSARR